MPHDVYAGIFGNFVRSLRDDEAEYLETCWDVMTEDLEFELEVARRHEEGLLRGKHGFYVQEGTTRVVALPNARMSGGPRPAR